MKNINKKDIKLPKKTKKVFDDFKNKKNFEVPKNFKQFLKEIKK